MGTTPVSKTVMTALTNQFERLMQDVKALGGRLPRAQRAAWDDYCAAIKRAKKSRDPADVEAVQRAEGALRVAFPQSKDKDVAKNAKAKK
ncbi:hypothetical protein [Allokutzneria oryzae]|uniref:Uncharacterized protein n=1 Tax=Allokutzneria oryzae TaxID=1378989 RepID=A0ABV5ZZF1_9PSEU